MEIRLDKIGALLAKPKAQNFETRRLKFYCHSQITKEKGLFAGRGISVRAASNFTFCSSFRKVDVI